MKTQWIPTDNAEPIEEHECEDQFFFSNDTMVGANREDIKAYLGGDFEFVQVLHEDKPMYMLVHEMGAMIPLPVNARATDIYHTAVVKPRCKDKGFDYNPQDYAQIHGPAILVMEQMT